MCFVAELAFAEVVVRPVVAEVDDRAGRVWSGRFGEGGSDDGGVGLVVADGSEGEAERVLDEAGERRPDDVGDLADLGDRDRWQAVVVEQSLEQSN